MNPAEKARLARFMERLLDPVPAHPEAEGGTHTGIARALLASRHKWPRADLQFIRGMVCATTATQGDYGRLIALLQSARERTA